LRAADAKGSAPEGRRDEGGPSCDNERDQSIPEDRQAQVSGHRRGLVVVIVSHGIDKPAAWDEREQGQDPPDALGTHRFPVDARAAFLKPIRALSLAASVGCSGASWDTGLVDRQGVREAAVGAGYPPPVADWLATKARAAARLEPRRRSPEAGVAASKIGGLPDLSPRREWPSGEHGPMTFCGQVATAGVEFLRGVDSWQPSRGLLLFFADKDPDGDNVEAGAVLFEGGPVERRPAPGALHAHSRFDEAPVDAVPVLSPPSIDLIANGDDGLDYEGDEFELWERFTNALALPDGMQEPAHQFFGEPLSLESDALENGSWQLGLQATEPMQDRDLVRLLAQFTTDQELNIDMADGGVICFVIGLDDLQAGRYDRVAVRIDSC
jgi:hypothetical protein